MNLDTYVQIWKGYQTYMCILETMHTEEEEEREKEVEEEKRDEVCDGIDIMHPHLSLREQGAATDQED